VEKIIRRYDFIERTLYLIKKALEESLPEEATLEEMADKASEIIKKEIK